MRADTGGANPRPAPAMFEELIYDEDGNILNGSLMDYLVPTAVETPNWETDQTVTPSPIILLGLKVSLNLQQWGHLLQLLMQ
ncbi:MAG: hypothetical protein Ct9H300mP28_00820 [Pseudomonadota bacterium]|nr:MAG: hypothetical protein Ct9H300mP28_00820 [Pseudomonadota bacterium]